MYPKMLLEATKQGTEKNPWVRSRNIFGIYPVPSLEFGIDPWIEFWINH